MGFNFLEAVQALKNGECEGIRRKVWEGHVRWEDSKLIQLSFDSALADDWELFNPIPATEEVTIQKWGLVSDGGNAEVYDSRQEACENWASGWHLVELTGTYSRPVKRKVKKREAVGTFQIHQGSMLPYYNHIPQNANLFAEWEE